MPGPIPFPGSQNVPIVGEPARIEAWTGTFLVICKHCQPNRNVLVPGLAPLTAVCGGCGRGFQVLGVSALQGEPLNFQLNIVLPPDAPMPVQDAPAN